MSQNPYEQHPSKPDYPGIPATVYGSPSSNYGPYGSPDTPPPPPELNNIGPNPYDPYAPATVISQKPNLSPTYPAYPSQPGIPPIPTPMPPPQKKSTSKMGLVAVIALLVIVGGSVFGTVAYNNNQVTMHATATATAQANATAQTQAQANATATAQTQANTGTFNKVALNNPLNSDGNEQWSGVSGCTFTGGAYQVNVDPGHFQWCLATNTSFDNFAYQITMTILSGDCGALLFRATPVNAAQGYYYFQVCQDGRYSFGSYDGQSLTPLVHFTTSSKILAGLNKPNILAVSVDGNRMSLYVNDNTQPIQTVTDPNSTFSTGKIGVWALSLKNPTTVAFTNAIVWTR